MRKRHWYAVEPSTIYVFDKKVHRDKFVKRFPETVACSAVQIVKHVQSHVVITIKGE